MKCDRILAAAIAGVIGTALAGAQQAPPAPPQAPTPGVVEERLYGAPPTIPTDDEAHRLPTEFRTLDDIRTYLAKAPPEWNQFVAEWLTPIPIPAKDVLRIEGDDRYAYPHVAVSFKMEIVKEEDDIVWLRGLPPEDPESPLHERWLDTEAKQRFLRDQLAWEAEYGITEYWLDFAAEPLPPPVVDGYTFERVAESLPTRGRWQMNFTLDDMNEDGYADLVFPPMRKGSPFPWVFLGSGDGEFAPWQGMTWPQNVAFDYGGVTTGDFDGDGHRDIVLATHFKAQYILYGNGAGDFSRAQRLPSPDPRITSRAVASGDLDGDGRPDLAFLAEVNYDLTTSKPIQEAPVCWLLINQDGTSWRLVRHGLPQQVIGDDILVFDANGDGTSDILTASNAAHYRQLLYLADGDGGWQAAGHNGVLSNAYHFGIDSFFNADGDIEVYSPFVQFKMIGGEKQGRTGVIRYEVGDDGLAAPHGTVMLDDDRTNVYFRVAAGDLNDDGLADIVAGRKNGGIEVWIQTAPGQYYREQGAELELEAFGTAYSIDVVDLDGDGDDDIVAAFAEDPQKKRVGGIRVWLTRPRA